jgi:deazaflavin-dependent oxidoreductase (nitroreductase family)
MRLKMPEGNTIVLAILRSPAHRLLSGQAIELRYTGRKSGREYALPVQYVRDGDRLIVRPQGAQRKTWWRNFRTPQPVAVRLAGRAYEATAQVLDHSEPGWEGRAPQVRRSLETGGQKSGWAVRRHLVAQLTPPIWFSHATVG